LCHFRVLLPLAGFHYCHFLFFLRFSRQPFLRFAFGWLISPITDYAFFQACRWRRFTAFAMPLPFLFDTPISIFSLICFDIF